MFIRDHTSIEFDNENDKSFNRDESQFNIGLALVYGGNINFQICLYP